MKKEIYVLKFWRSSKLNCSKHIII